MKGAPLVLLIAAFACSPTESVEPGADSLIPFAVGNQWTYSIADSGQTAVIHDSAVTVRILEESVANGIRWYRTDPVGTLGTYSSFGWFRNTRAGVHHALSPTS